MKQAETVKVEASPTPQFLERLVNSFVGLTPTIAQVSRVVFVDSNNVERDWTTSLTYALEAGKVKMTCYITASASYTLKAVRTYDVNQVLLTETLISRSISSGVTYPVTVYLNFNIQSSSGYQYFSGYLKQILYDVLRGAESASKLRIVYVGIQLFVYIENMSYVYDVEATVTKLSSTSFRIDASRSFEGGFSCLEGFRVRNADFTDMYGYLLLSCQDIPVTSYVTYAEVVTLSG